MATTWREQFEGSLSNYASSEDSLLRHVYSIDAFVDGYIHDHQRDDRQADAAIALRALALQAFMRTYGEFEKASEACESPIESAMLLALTLVGRDRLDQVYFTTDRCRIDAADYEYMVIEPQARLGKHRVDFLVMISSLEPVAGLGSSAVSLDPRGAVEHRLVVECDGHDFHDRTKEQASRDRARDRTLQLSSVVPVFRYTGADIWKDVMGCASEVVDALQAGALARADPG